MANALDRWKALLGTMKDAAMTQPTDAEALAVARDLVQAYERKWGELLDAKGLVRDPDTPDDPFVIGTTSENSDGTETFSSVTNRRRNRLIALHARRVVRDFLGSVSEAQELKTGAVTAADTGKTTEEVRTRMKTDAETKVATAAGARNDDTED